MNLTSIKMYKYNVVNKKHKSLHLLSISFEINFMIRPYYNKIQVDIPLFRCTLEFGQGP